jgi:glycosyltransferase involved in cell wall biosynthesis
MIAHSVSDLMALKDCMGPRLLVLHTTLEGRAANQSTTIPEGYAETTRRYLELVGAHAIAVSPLKARSWGFVHDIVTSGVHVDSYPPYDGRTPSGIRVANQILDRRDYFLWDFHVEAFGDVPMRLVGHNPGMPGVERSTSWDDLKALLAQHRFYVHTAHPHLEDGFNMAMMEAMASGLPVLGNCHPSSPVEDGVSGFLSDDPKELRAHALRLLADRELAARMGQEARRTAARRFSSRKFVVGVHKAIGKAQKKWNTRMRAAAPQPASSPGA